MIEIVFSNSACGALKVAQSFGKGEYRGSCIGVFIAHGDGSDPTQAEIDEKIQKFEELERHKWEKSVPLGGKPSDVYGLHLGLSFGSITDPLSLDDRLSAMQILLGCWNEDLQEEFKDMILQTQQDLQIILKRIANSEDVRVWYSDNPDELCGFYWFMDQLRSLPVNHGAIYAIKQPYIVETEDSIHRYRGWGEVDPGDFHRFLPLSVLISDFESRYYGNEWKELQRQNAVLRASVNGKLSSVPENIYDIYILQEIDEQPELFKEAIVVGNVLGKHGLSISDGYIHSRIDRLVEEGKIIAETAPKEGDPGYWRILRKCH